MIDAGPLLETLNEAGIPSETKLLLPLSRWLSHLDAPTALWPTLAGVLDEVGGDFDYRALDAALEAFAGAEALEDSSARVDRLHVALRFAATEVGGSVEPGRRRRRADGVFYTPELLSRWLVRRASSSRAPEAVCDCACGAGSFLLAALDLAKGRAPRLVGVDIDPIAVEITRVRLFSELTRRGLIGPSTVEALVADVRVGDGLEVELPQVDLVVGNPPFGNAISSDTARDESVSERHKALFGELAAGSYDLSFLFVARGVTLLREHGRYGFILPMSVLSLSSAAPLRSHLAELAPPTTIWTPSSSRLFHGADVLTAILVGERGAAPAEVQVSTAAMDEVHGGPEDPFRAAPPRLHDTWSTLLSPERAILADLEDNAVAFETLGSLFEVYGGAATGAAYNLRPFIEEGEGEGHEGLALITTGLIDRYACLWGERRCRYLKSSWLHPRWPAEDGEGVPKDVQRASMRQREAKILVAGLSKVVEAIADPEGALGGVVSTWCVSSSTACWSSNTIWLLEAALNAPIFSLVYMVRYAGKALSGGNTTVGRRELSAMPIFADVHRLGANSLSSSAPSSLDAVFTLDANSADDRAAVASALINQLRREAPCGGISEALDASAAAAISWLYGASAAEHAEVVAWFAERLPLRSRQSGAPTRAL